MPASSAKDDYFATTWGFYLIPQNDGTTKLIARFRTDYNAKFANTLMYGPPLVEPISCVIAQDAAGYSAKGGDCFKSQGGA